MDTVELAAEGVQFAKEQLQPFPGLARQIGSELQPDMRSWTTLALDDVPTFRTRIGESKLRQWRALRLAG